MKRFVRWIVAGGGVQAFGFSVAFGCRGIGASGYSSST